MSERLRHLLKSLRREASAVSLRKLSRLDRSDQTLMAQRLEQVLQDLCYIQTVCDARCSIVVEALEYYRSRTP